MPFGFLFLPQKTSVHLRALVPPTYLTPRTNYEDKSPPISRLRNHLRVCFSPSRLAAFPVNILHGLLHSAFTKPLLYRGFLHCTAKPNFFSLHLLRLRFGIWCFLGFWHLGTWSFLPKVDSSFAIICNHDFHGNILVASNCIHDFHAKNIFSVHPTPFFHHPFLATPCNNQL